jgi:hypothetical protein
MQNRFDNSTIVQTVKGLLNIQFRSPSKNTLNSVLDSLTMDEGTAQFVIQLSDYCIALYAVGGTDITRCKLFELADALKNTTLIADEEDNVHLDTSLYHVVNILKARQLKSLLFNLNQTAIDHYLKPGFENSTFLLLRDDLSTDWDLETYIPSGVFETQEFERVVKQLRYLLLERFSLDTDLADAIFKDILSHKLNRQQELDDQTSLIRNSIRELENGAFDAWQPQVTSKLEETKLNEKALPAALLASPDNLLMLQNTSQANATNALPGASPASVSSTSILFQMLVVGGVIAFIAMRLRPLSSLIKNSLFSNAPKAHRSEYAALEGGVLLGNEQDNLLKPSKMGRRYG